MTFNATRVLRKVALGATKKILYFGFFLNVIIHKNTLSKLLQVVIPNLESNSHLKTLTMTNFQS